MTIRGYQLAIDWSRHGVFTNTREDVSADVLDGPEVVVTWGRTEPRATEDAAAGRITFALENVDRAYSPENTGSPIAGKVLPGTRVRFQVTSPTTAAITTLFDGPLDALDVDPTAPARDFTGEALDGWGVPGAEQLSTPVYDGKRTGDLINVVLDAIGWDPVARDIDPGATLVSWWWAEGVDAATAITDLVHSEGPPAVAYVMGGVFVFRDRHHRLLKAASLSSQGTCTHIVPAGTGPPGDFKILKDTFTYDHGLKNIFNTVTAEVTARTPADVTHVWESTTPISLAANEVTQLIAQANDPFILAQPPTLYVFDGDGNPLSGDYSLSGGSIASIDLSRTSGQTCVMTITAGGSGAYLDRGMSLSAVPLVPQATEQVTESDTASIGTFRRQSWPGSFPWANRHDARALAQRIVAVYASARPSVTFSIDAATGSTYPDFVFDRRISDRITVQNDELGLNADFMVETLQHTVRKLGVRHLLRVGAQVVDPSQAATAFTFDVAGRGFNDGQFVANGITDPASMFQFDVAGHGFDQGRFAA